MLLSARFGGGPVVSAQVLGFGSRQEFDDYMDKLLLRVRRTFEEQGITAPDDLSGIDTMDTVIPPYAGNRAKPCRIREPRWTVIDHTNNNQIEHIGSLSAWATSKGLSPSALAGLRNTGRYKGLYSVRKIITLAQCQT
jgi:hypothetical protein